MTVAVETFAGTKLHLGDIAVLVGYFAFVLFVGLWTSRQNRGSAGGYFLAGRNMHWIPVGASLFASNIGSLHFIGLAGSGAAAGIAIANYELNSLFVLIAMAYIFLPVYIASGIYTMPQYLQKRFGGMRIQIFLSVLTLVMYIFTKISADLYSGSIFIEQALNWDMYGAVSLLLGIAAIFTITGGLTAVIWTDFIQTIIMLIGASVLMIISFKEVGGFNAMVEKYPHAMPARLLESNSTCGKPRDDYMHLFREPGSSDIPWPGLIGVTINSVWYWCSDQVIVQRALAAKTFSHAKGGTLMCGFLKLLPLFMLVFPGMIARILFPETVGCSDPDICKEVCGSSSGCSNIAYSTLVINLLPAGARGMMLAVMLAALMSSLTSIFNSSSTIFAMDVWTNIRKKASELEVMIVGRVFVVFLVIVSIIWIPVIKASQGTQLYVYIQEVSSFLQPPICAIFVLGLFWERLNEKGAFFSLLIGFLAGIIRFTIQYSFSTPECGSSAPDQTPDIVKNFHYLYFSIFLFLLTILAAVVISLLTRPIDKRCLQRLTWWTRHSREPRLDIQKWLASQTDDAGHELHTDVRWEQQTLEINTYRITDDLEGDDSGISGHDSSGVCCDSVVNAGESSGDSGAENNGVSGDNGAEDGTADGKSRAVPELTVVIEDESKTRVIHSPSSAIPLKIFNWICGIDHASKNQLSNKQIDEVDMLSISEPRSFQRLTAIMTILLACSVLFLYGFFA